MQAPAQDASGSTGPSKTAAAKWTWYGIAFGMVIIVGGIVSTLLLGYKPQPVRIMKPSFFADPAALAATVLKRFYVPLEKEPVVVLGVNTDQPWSAELVAGFILAAAKDQRPFDTVVGDTRLPDAMKEKLTEAAESVSAQLLFVETNLAEPRDLISRIDFATPQTKLLIVVPDLYSSHSIDGNMVNRLEKRIGRNLFAFSAGRLALARDEEKSLSPVCIGSERDGAGTSGLGCLYAQASRFYYRKRVLENEPDAKSKFTAIMVSPIANDVAILVRPPSL